MTSRSIAMSAAGSTGGDTDDYFENNVLLLQGDGTNGAQNNTFVDSANPGTALPYGGYAGYFDGTGDYCKFAYTSAFDLSGSDWTMEAWFNASSFASGWHIISKDTWGSNFDWSIYAPNNTSLVLYTAATTQNITVTVPAMSTGTWYHVAYVRSAGTTTIYLNGVSYGSSSMGLANSSQTSVTIGCAGYNNPNSFFNGYISNLRVVKGVAVYTGNFTPPSLGALATSGSSSASSYPSTTNVNTTFAAASTSLLTCISSSFVDASVNNNAITVYDNAKIISAIGATVITRNGNVTQGSFSPYGNLWSNYFDGSGDYLSVPSNAAFAFSTGDFTLEAWINFSNLQSSGSTHILESTVTNGLFLKTTTTGVCIGRSNTAEDSIFTYSFTTGTWYHVAFTRVASTVYCYINGVLLGSSANSINYVQGGYYIGSAGSGQYFNGYISNVRIVKGSAVYTSNFTPITTPLAVVSNTSLLTCQSNRLIDNSTNNFAITKTGDVKVTNFAPFNPSSSYFANSIGGSAYFDGTGDYLDIPANSNFVLDGQFTIECWYYQNAVATYPTVFELGQYSNGILFRPVNSTNGSLWVNNTQYYTSLATPINSWVHVAISRNSSNVLSMFINGQRLYSGTIAGSINSTGALLRIGTSVHDASQHHNGYISNFRLVKGSAVYDPTLTTLPVPTSPVTVIPNTVLLCNFTNSGVVDSSTKTNLETIGNAQISTSVKKYGTGSLYFDGSGDYLIPSATSDLFAYGTGDFTIEFWIYPNATQTCALYDPRPASGNGAYVYLGLESNSLSFYAQSAFRIQSAALPNSTWSHVALVRYKSVTKMYINGVPVATTYADTNSYINAAGRPIIGAAGYTLGGSGFNGYLDDFRITKGIARYTGIFIPPDLGATDANITTDPHYRNVSLLLRANSTVSQNNTFIDSANPGQSIFNGSYSAYFDGTGDYLSSTSNVAIGTGTFTIECWVRPTVTDTDRCVISNAYWWQGNNGGYRVYITNSNKIQLSASNGVWNTFPIIATSNSNVIPNVWTHIAIVRDASNNVTIYINGVADATVSYSTSLNLNNGGASQSMQIAGSTGDGSWWNLYTGYISNIRISTAAVYSGNFTPPSLGSLATSGSSSSASYPSTTNVNTTFASASTIFLTCNSSTFVDSSSNNFAITASGDSKLVSSIGGTVITRSGNVTQGSFTPYWNLWSNYFDGTTGYFTVPSNTALNFGTGDFTVEFWCFYPPVSYTYGKMALDGRPAGTNGNYWFFGTGSTGIMTFTAQADNVSVFDTVARSNQWVHYAVSRQGTSLRMFANGVQVSSATSAGIVDSGGVFIGSNAFNSIATGSYWSGYMSNVRIVKGTAVYTSNFTPSTTPLTAISGTSLLICQSNRFKDSSSNNLAITRNGGGIINITNFAPFKPTTAYSPSVNGGSAYFDGTGDSLSVPTSSSFDFGSGNFTVEFWYFKTGTQETYARYFQTANGDTYTGISITQNNTTQNQINVSISSNGSSWDICNTLAGTIVEGSWNHCALVRNGSNFTFYVNGIGTSIVTSSSSVYYNAAHTPVIGGQTGTSRSLNGYVSNFRVVKGIAVYTSNFTPPTAVLTAIANTSLLCNFANAGIYDSTAHIIPETIGNAQVSANVKKYGSGSMYFDGNGDYLTMKLDDNFNFGTADFTIEMWAYPLTTNHQSACLFSQEHIAASNTAISLSIFLNGGSFEAVNNYVGFGTYNGSAGSTWVTLVHGSAATSIPINTWSHIALVRNGNVFTLYINGAAVSTVTNSTSCSLGSTQYMIGRRWDTYGSYPYFNGYIDDFRITRGVARYTGGFTPPEKALPTF